MYYIQPYSSTRISARVHVLLAKSLREASGPGAHRSETVLILSH